MKVDSVLILAAGSGTRMGKIGEVLPKVQWPIFEKSLLHLQVEYAKTFFPASRIYINIYHQKEKLRDYIESSSFAGDVEIIEEREKLDIGGAIHNLAHKLDYKGYLLILNGDQFLEINKETIEKKIIALQDNSGILFSYKVNSNEQYNALIGNGTYFKEVRANKDIPKDTEIMTYTGMSLWNLQKLTPHPGYSRFFDTVAHIKNGKILVVELEDIIYWDFGTTQRYYNSMFNLLRATKTGFKDFLITCGAFDQDKKTVNGYNSNSGINLSNEYVTDCFLTIILAKSDQKINQNKEMLIYQNIIQELVHL